MVDETNSLEEIRAYFAQDKFAAQAQCSIIEAAPNHAIDVYKRQLSQR